jgi:hypothetical protein
MLSGATTPGSRPRASVVPRPRGATIDLDNTTEAPDDALLDFVDELPATVKDLILARCCMAFGRLQPVPRQDLSATFRAIVRAGDAVQAAYTCAQMVAVLELVLCSPDAPLPAAWHEAAAAQRLYNIDMQSPLTRKHWEAAHEGFSRLRATLLHSQSLRRMLLRELTPMGGRR